MTRGVKINVDSAIRCNKKMKPLIIALLETAATQGATLREFSRACEIAVMIAEDEMSQSNVCVTEFVRRGIASIEVL